MTFVIVTFCYTATSCTMIYLRILAMYAPKTAKSKHLMDVLSNNLVITQSFKIGSTDEESVATLKKCRPVEKMKSAIFSHFQEQGPGFLYGVPQAFFKKS